MRSPAASPSLSRVHFRREQGGNDGPRRFHKKFRAMQRSIEGGNERTEREEGVPFLLLRFKTSVFFPSRFRGRVERGNNNSLSLACASRVSSSFHYSFVSHCNFLRRPLSPRKSNSFSFSLLSASRSRKARARARRERERERERQREKRKRETGEQAISFAVVAAKSIASSFFLLSSRPLSLPPSLFRPRPFFPRA